MNSNVSPNLDSLTKLHQRVREHVSEAMRTLPLDPKEGPTRNSILILLHLLAMVVNIANEFASQAGTEQAGENEISKLYEKNDFSDACDLNRILKYTKLLKAIPEQLVSYSQDLQAYINTMGQ